MGAYAGPDIVESGLVLALDAGNLKSYPGTGTAWTDLSGNGRNGTFNNMEIPGDYASTNGGILTFDGGNEFVACSGSITVTAATFMAWIRRNGDQSEFAAILIGRGTSPTGMNFSGTINGSVINKLVYTWNDSISTYGWANGPEVPNLTWCMVAVSVTSSAATAYVFQASGYDSKVNSPGHSGATLSSIKIAVNDFGARYFKGDIAQVSVYNRALSATEIQQNFNATRSRYGL
jgi:hypothetical protein